VKIGIVGTGAMGSVYAGLFARAGNEVWAVDVWREHLDAIAARGLHVSGASGDFVASGISVATGPAGAGPCDVWIVATKAADVDTAAATVAPLLRPDDVVLAMQNGLGAPDRIARRVPAGCVLIGIAEGFGSSIPEPGRVHHNGMRLIRLGEMPPGGMTDRLRRMETLWRDAGFNVKAYEDVEPMIWEKFLCNVTLSAPTTAFDVTVGELMADPRMWRVALGCMLEAYRVGVEKQVRFSFADPVEYVTEFAATIPDASPSMRLDHLAGRRSEIEVINGQVVELSRELGLEAPYNEALCAVVRAREARFPR
jgi:2-dehydropantoate 2-reductase